jgi:uncharacterized protein (DUF2141 family)
MTIKHCLCILASISIFYFTAISISGCAQIGMPTGGAKDTIAPVLLSASPAERTTNFNGNRVVLTFNEYIDVQDPQNNVLVSPYPKSNPNISFKLKTVTVKIKDTLLPNTTYAINFGNAIRDNNEGNPFRNYIYVFSTGNTIDSLNLTGNVILAQSGKIDSTLVAMLYRNAPDSAIETRKPDYLAKLNGDGKFKFTNLSPGTYKLYALKDGDGGKTYNSKIELFAFNNDDVIVNDSTKPVTLHAYAEEKDTRPAQQLVNSTPKTPAEKKLKYTIQAIQEEQSLLSPLQVVFNKSVRLADDKKIMLTDSFFRKKNDVSITLDSTKKVVTLNTQWAEEFDYRLIIDKDAVTDTLGNALTKTDTIRFKTKSTADYGNVLIRFKNYDAAKHSVLQFFKTETLVRSVHVTGTQWGDKLFEPGEYELRVLFDDNNNGQWDPGNYHKKLQPEKVVTLEKRITVKANWDNEKDVEL